MLEVSRHPELVRGFYTAICDHFAGQVLTFDGIVVNLCAAIDEHRQCYPQTTARVLFPILFDLLRAFMGDDELACEIKNYMCDHGLWPELEVYPS